MTIIPRGINWLIIESAEVRLAPTYDSEIVEANILFIKGLFH